MSTTLQYSQPEGQVMQLVLAQLCPAAANEHGLPALPAVLGRDPSSAAVVINDGTVSRAHARLEIKDGGLYLRDMESRRGLFVNQARITEAAVRPGDIIRLGDVVLRLLSRAADDPAPHAGEAQSLLVGGASLAPLRGEISAAAASEMPVLLLGEVGTGKKLAAREIHRLGKRRGPFVGVDCAVLAEGDAEAELCGQGRGSSPAAEQAGGGLLEAARGGTLFLDDVTALPASCQEQLARLVETRNVHRAGSAKVRKLECDVICAATTAEQSVASPLLALAECRITLPPLREHAEDLPLLVSHFCRHWGRELRLGPDAVEALACYAWPLNVQELKNLLRGLVAKTSPQAVIDLSMLPAPLGASSTKRRSSTAKASANSPAGERHEAASTAAVAEPEAALGRQSEASASSASVAGRDRRPRAAGSTAATTWILIGAAIGGLMATVSIIGVQKWRAIRATVGATVSKLEPVPPMPRRQGATSSPTPKPAASPGGSRDLWVVSEPAGATVFLAGREVGKTPLRMDAAGLIAVELRLAGYLSKTASVPSGDVPLFVKLEREEAAAAVPVAADAQASTEKEESPAPPKVRPADPVKAARARAKRASTETKTEQEETPAKPKAKTLVDPFKD